MSYTKLPNYIIDDYLDALEASELKVLLLVLRKSVGFQQPTVRLSLDQMMTATNLGRRQVLYAIKTLETYKILNVDRRPGRPSVYGVHYNAPGGALYCTGGVQRSASPIDKRNHSNGHLNEKEREILARVVRS